MVSSRFEKDDELMGKQQRTDLNAKPRGHGCVVAGSDHERARATRDSRTPVISSTYYEVRTVPIPVWTRTESSVRPANTFQAESAFLGLSSAPFGPTTSAAEPLRGQLVRNERRSWR